MENKFLKLTNTVYKVLEFFPEADPLKTRAKDKALAIMEHLISVNDNSGWVSFQKEKIKVQLSEDIDILLGYLWIGEAQGWLNSTNCIIISNEYEKIKKEFSPIIEPIEPPKPVLDNTVEKKPQVVSTGINVKIPGSFNISGRQKKIIEFLNKNEKAQVMDLMSVLPNVTKRTIRRDLDELMKFEKITRLGEFNQVFYRIKG